ncbi:MAG: pentapeptide repeat-containing protein [Anaerolineales bacterium]|nr:pentapeptide repeat-containing protein [Anaerolineales bacterium]
MANAQHVQLIHRGVDTWNLWRNENPEIRPDLSGANFNGLYLGGFNLSLTDLSCSNLTNAKFVPQFRRTVPITRIKPSREEITIGTSTQLRTLRANLDGANLNKAKLTSANLGGASLCWAHLVSADLRGAQLTTTDLRWANCHRANFSGALLSQVKLEGANLVEVDFSNAHLLNCHIYGVNVWEVNLNDAIQQNLIITRLNEQPVIGVDSLEVAHFVYLLLANRKIRDLIDIAASKVVVILGRFTEERLAILEAIWDELRKHNYVSVLFNFEKPGSRTLMETVGILAHLSRFIIADLTDAKGVAHELATLVRDLKVPFQPILLDGSKPYAMSEDLILYHWFLEPFYYSGSEDLLCKLEEQVIAPAEAKLEELLLLKQKGRN